MLKPRGVTRNVIALGWVSFFTDAASEMIYPLIPLFFVGVLGVTPIGLGIVEGFAEGGSTALRWITGALSDRFRKRKPFIVAGYSLSAISKPIMGLSGFALGWPIFVLGRLLDRSGKAVRTAARDALIADSTAPEDRGSAFGFHRLMDQSGAVVGPLVGLTAITFFARIFVGKGLSGLFFIALVPGALSALTAVVFVRDIPHEAKSISLPPLLQKFQPRFWLLLVAVGIFSLGNSSDTFILLRSKDLGLSPAGVILIYALFNASYALLSLPFGQLSDRIGRKPLIVAGWLVYAGVYAAFARANAPIWMWILMPIYGIYQAMTDGVSKALVTDVVNREQRGGAIGWYYTVAGGAQLAGSILAGALWKYRVQTNLLPAFLLGSLCALIAAAVIAAMPTSRPAN